MAVRQISYNLCTCDHHLAVPSLLESALRSITPFGLLHTQLSELLSTSGHSLSANESGWMQRRMEAARNEAVTLFVIILSAGEVQFRLAHTEI